MASTSRSLWKLAALLPLGLAANTYSQPAIGVEVASSNTWNFHHEHVLGTSLQITVRAMNAKQAHLAEQAALKVFDQDTAILSTWRPDSEISRWARTRFEPVTVSPTLYSVLAAFDTWRERTAGALDASVETATRLWQETTAQGRVPSAQEIALAVEAMQQPHWQLDRTCGTATRLSATPLAFASFTKSSITSRAADAALNAGASGVMLNVGGDIVVRGKLAQWVDVADPRSAAENSHPLTHVVLQNRAIATSGSYRRGVALAATSAHSGAWFSHLIDPRSAQPAAHVLSSTVVARDAETAGALATAFAILPVGESERLAGTIEGVEYLLVLADGSEVTNSSWGRKPVLTPAAYESASRAAGKGTWDPAFELSLKLALPRIADTRYRRPYVAVWIEDADHVPVRTLALWTQNPRWLPDLKQWYRDDQLRTMVEGTDISRTISSATRPPGEYTLKWDGKDNAGKPVKAGRYTVLIEAAREHGGYDLDRHELDFNGSPQQVSLPESKELGVVTLDYRRR